MIPPDARDALLARFLRYVAVDTQSDPDSASAPSTARQMDLIHLLADECRALGLADIVVSPHGPMKARIDPTADATGAPAIVWCSHVDTSPENPGCDVRPRVIDAYDGGLIRLSETQTIDPAEHPDLAGVTGQTLVVTDGTTLLGADDKAGLAVIMTAAAMLKAGRQPHGPITLLFTVDEEIGRGTEHLDPAWLAGHACGYTLDGDGAGKINAETFSADAATVVVHGVNIHPSIGKGRMVSAIDLLARFLTAVRAQLPGPDATDGRDGFVHPHTIRGGVERAECELILRSFETPELAEQADALRAIAKRIEADEPRGRIQVTIREQYRNMRDGLGGEPRAVSLAEAAIEQSGLTLGREAIRGGTDGSLITAMGLPMPNLSTGQHTPHSLQEWASLDEMASAVAVLLNLAGLWAGQTAESPLRSASGSSARGIESRHGHRPG